MVTFMDVPNVGAVRWLANAVSMPKALLAHKAVRRVLHGRAPQLHRRALSWYDARAKVKTRSGW